MGAVVDHVVLAAVLVFAIVLFWTRRLPNDLTAVLVMLSLVVPWPHPDGQWRGVLPYDEAFAGFGSSAVIMIAAMFVFGGALVQTGVAESVGVRLFRKVAAQETRLQGAILASTTFFSMFINDTTIVLVFLPVVLTLCRERNLAPSRYLIFVAYGSLLGGQWTLLGTRSNILISDFLRSATGEGLGFFDFTPVAAGVFVLSAAFLLTLGRRALPRSGGGETQPHSAAAQAENREYLTEVLVTPESDIIGRRLGELGWNKRQDMAVVEVLRGRDLLPRGAPFAAGDVIVVQGRAQVMQDLLKTPDLQLKEEVKIDPESLQSVSLVTVEALVAPRSAYRGLTFEEVDFQAAYGFTVMGIARRGRPVRRRPTELPLQFGDYLLLLGHVDALAQLRQNEDLILLGERSIPAVGRRKAAIAVALLLAVIGTAIGGLLAPPVSVPIAAALAVLLGCISLRRAYESIDWSTVITLGAMITYGTALEATGAAADVARLMVRALADQPPQLLLGGMLLLAVLLTQVIENAAVAIILAPVALQVASATGADLHPFMVALAISVSSGFCTPVAHESTILIAGPGGYEFRHFLRLGGVLALATWLVATLLTPIVWPLG